MAPKSMVLQLRPGVSAATLPDHRKMVPGVQYVVDWNTFSKISNGALENVVEVVTVNATGSQVWLSDNSNVVIGTILGEGVIGTVALPTYQLGGGAFQGFNGGLFAPQLGTTVTGAQDERFMLVQNGESAHVIAGGDVLVWKDKTARLVTNQRPTYVAPGDTEVGGFAGVALDTIGDSYYGWIQIEGECDAVSVTTSTVNAGDAVAVGTAGIAKSVNEGLVDIENIYVLTSNSVSGTFTLTLNGVTTAAISATASAAAIVSALELIAPELTITGSGGALGTNPVTLNITGEEVLLSGSFGSLASAAVTTGGSTTARTVLESAGATGGTFTLTGAYTKFTFTGAGTEALSIQIGNGTTAGTFTLASTAGSTNTSSLNYNASGTTIAAALSTASGLTYTATNGSVLLSSGTALTFTMSGDDTVTLHTETGMDWTTAPIAYHATAAATETAVNTAGGAGLVSGNSGGPLPTTVNLTFSTDPSTFTAASSLTGGATTTFTITSTTVTESSSVVAPVFGQISAFGLVVTNPAGTNFLSGDIQWNTTGVVLLNTLLEVPQFPATSTQSGGALPGTAIVVTYPATYAVATGVIVTAAVDENLAYTHATGGTFGTALTGGATTSIQVHIRSGQAKTPYHRFDNRN